MAFGAFLQSCVRNESAQSVFAFQRLRKDLTNLSSAFCWFWDASVCLIVVLAWASVCWEAGVTFVTSKM